MVAGVLLSMSPVVAVRRIPAIGRDSAGKRKETPFKISHAMHQDSARGTGYILHATDFGADPNATTDSTSQLQAALDALDSRSVPQEAGHVGAAGATLSLDGGAYLVSSPLWMRAANTRLCCGMLIAPPSFNASEFMLHVQGGELVTIEDVSFDMNHTGGGLDLNGVLRASIERTYFVHYSSIGVRVREGHEVHVGSSFFGEYWWTDPARTAGNMTGTAIEIDGQDHWISDVTIFAGYEGIRMKGGAALIEGVHAYPGGKGAALHLEGYGARSIRAVGNYWDGRGVVLEAPFQHVEIAQSLFLQGTGVEVRATKGSSLQGKARENEPSGRQGGALPDAYGLLVQGNQYQLCGHSSEAPGQQPNVTVWVNASSAEDRVLAGAQQVVVRDNTVDGSCFQQAVTRMELSGVLTPGDAVNGTGGALRSVWLPVSVGGGPRPDGSGRSARLVLDAAVAPPRPVAAQAWFHSAQVGAGVRGDRA